MRAARPLQFSLKHIINGKAIKPTPEPQPSTSAAPPGYSQSQLVESMEVDTDGEESEVDEEL